MPYACIISEKPYYLATLSMATNSGHKGFALDVGCGKNPYLLNAYLVNYIGIDIDIKTLKEVSRDLPEASFVCASGSYAPFKDHVFDLVICTEVLEHLKNPKSVIAEFSRVLTLRGTVVVSIPSLSLPQIIILWIAYRVRTISEKPYQAPSHLREYARFKVTPHFEKTSDLFEMFRQEGLEVQDSVTVSSLYLKPELLYAIFFSKIEKAFEKFFSKQLMGHNTIFRAKKK